jgi:ABC-type branched-subunit amino acid transport system substrate-binding protein
MDAMAAASLTQDMDLTVISPSADLPALADNSKYRYFLRTSPSMSVDVDIMIAVLVNASIKHVAVIYDDVRIKYQF